MTAVKHYIITFIRQDYSKTDPEKERQYRSKEDYMVKNNLLTEENVKARVIIKRELPDSIKNIPIKTTETPMTAGSYLSFYLRWIFS